ncbi:hypothetical protein [Myxosarcina sp. GI1(2024)]
MLIEEPIGFTVWIEDKNLNLLSGSESMDIVNQIDLDDLVSKMRNIGGVQIEARRYRLKVYPKCFVGSEAVEWMQSNLKLTKKQAVRLGQRLIDENLVHHVLDQHKFADDFLFYRFYWNEK